MKKTKTEKVLYQKYISTHFDFIHSGTKINQGYALMNKYFSKNYLRWLPKNKKAQVLEIGCGMGHFLHFLEKQGFKNFTAIDLSEECISFCRQHLSIKKNRLITADAFDFLRKKELKFEAIIINDLLEHIKKDEIVEFLGLVRKSLSGNGKIIIKVVNTANPITGTSSRFCDFTHTMGFTEESLAQILRLAEFKKIKILGPSIWVFNPFINLVGKLLQHILSLFFTGLFLLYGRKTTRIFTKDLIAIAEK